MDNQIHPTAMVGKNVTLGCGNIINAYSIIDGNTKIGDNNIIGPHAVIGTPGQNSKEPLYNTSDKQIEIGNNNILREFTGIHVGCFTKITKIGDNNFLMQGSQVNHDCQLESNVILSPGVIIAGSCFIMEGANIGMGAMIHQGSIIGAYSMIAAGATVVKNIKPFAKFIPGHALSINDRFQNIPEHTREDLLSKFITLSEASGRDSLK